ncbi:MAG: YdcF family protein [Clostridiales bacterium]|nr:YdcF family protein [Clostridiales bacterium]
MTTKKKKITKIIKTLFISGLIAVIIFAALSGYCILSVKDKIYTYDSLSSSELCAELQKDPADAVIVLGCLVYNDTTPSPMLDRRIQMGIKAYKLGLARKILLSGDHGQKDYDEVNVMRKVALENGVPSEDIFMDHAGFSTYETMYRAGHVFGIKRAVVVTQNYHLYRSVYNAINLGVESIGIDSGNEGFVINPKSYPREFLAQAKDVVKCIFKPESTYVGDPIDIKGNGEVTLD